MDDAAFTDLEPIQAYYGRTLSGSADLRTDACTTAEAPDPALKRALANVHDEVLARYFGCGLIAPLALEGARVLDLGSGSGRDAYVLAQLVGEGGGVVGVDATREQLAVARRHLDWHRERFGYARSNVEFLEGDIARLDALGLEPESFDVIVSNCVINLVADKPAVFAAAHRLLKPGGELYFSDVYADRRPPRDLLADPVLRGECLAGALYWNDFHTLAKAAGFADPRLVSDRPLLISDPEVEGRTAPVRFFSATYRLWKLEGLEPLCEDYGQAVRYRGGLPGAEAVFTLDKHHTIEAGRAFPVCGNTWKMLAETRFARWFDFMGDFSRHYGVFEGCGTSLPFTAAGAGPAPTSGGCC
ncbi:MAG: methyltransferase domain-containing protein [Caulobacteraceae bacterium]|nr:methyltransferase domain-containing protein [Caulobacter sp.]